MEGGGYVPSTTLLIGTSFSPCIRHWKDCSGCCDFSEQISLFVDCASYKLGISNMTFDPFPFFTTTIYRDILGVGQFFR